MRLTALVEALDEAAVTGRCVAPPLDVTFPCYAFEGAWEREPWPRGLRATALRLLVDVHALLAAAGAPPNAVRVRASTRLEPVRLFTVDAPPPLRRRVARLRTLARLEAARRCRMCGRPAAAPEARDYSRSCERHRARSVGDFLRVGRSRRWRGRTFFAHARMRALAAIGAAGRWREVETPFRGVVWRLETRLDGAVALVDVGADGPGLGADVDILEPGDAGLEELLETEARARDALEAVLR